MLRCLPSIAAAENAFRYVVASGISAGAAYPYTGAVGPCQAGTRARVVRAKSFTEVASYSDAALMTAVARQPVAVAVAADSSCFQFYSSGVMNCPSCGVGLNHAVLLVGYGVDPATGLAYYRIRNQWGTYWGEATRFSAHWRALSVLLWPSRCMPSSSWTLIPSLACRRQRLHEAHPWSRSGVCRHVRHPHGFLFRQRVIAIELL